MRPGSRPGAAGGCNSLSEERLVCSGNSVDLLLRPRDTPVTAIIKATRHSSQC